MLVSSEEFERLFKEEYNYFCNLANKIINDKNASEDIVQDVFAKLWSKKNELNHLISFHSYLVKSVINTSVNHLEKQKKTIYNNEFSFSFTEIKIDEENTQKAILKLKKSVESLPEKCRAIFTLSRFEGLSNNEIAEYMGISVKTVENQMGIAFKKLREAMKENIKLMMFLFILPYFPRLFKDLIFNKVILLKRLEKRL